MAKQTKTVSMEESLWQLCNKMRGSIEPSEYKHVVLSLMFLKYAGDHFEKRRQEIITEGHAAFADMVEFYEAKNVFYHILTLQKENKVLSNMLIYMSARMS